jgi:hypothetical protein
MIVATSMAVPDQQAIEAIGEAVSLHSRQHPEMAINKIAHRTLEGCSKELNVRVAAPKEMKQAAPNNKRPKANLIAEPV